MFMFASEEISCPFLAVRFRQGMAVLTFKRTKASILKRGKVSIKELRLNSAHLTPKLARPMCQKRVILTKKYW